MAASRFGIGIDLGLPGEFSAMALVELTTPDDDTPPRCVVRNLVRFPTGTRFGEIAGAMRAQVDEHHPELISPWPFRNAAVALDVTAATMKVVDTFRIGNPPP